MSIGENIKRIRKEKKMTQKQLAEACGFKYQMIGQYENQVREPKLSSVKRIADALGVSKWDILGETPYPDWTLADNPPKPDEYVLLSFCNFPLPSIGMYKEDEDGGGAYYMDDNDISCSNYGIIVNGWMPLPKNMED